MADLTAILCGVLIPVGIFCKPKLLKISSNNKTIYAIVLIVILAIVLQNKFIYNSSNISLVSFGLSLTSSYTHQIPQPN